MLALKRGCGVAAAATVDNRSGRRAPVRPPPFFLDHDLPSVLVCPVGRSPPCSTPPDEDGSDLPLAVGFRTCA